MSVVLRSDLPRYSWAFFAVLFLCLASAACVAKKETPAPRTSKERSAPNPSMPSFDINSLETSLSNSRSQFPWDTAYALALLSRLAYTSEKNVRRQTAKWGFTKVESIAIASSNAFVASSDKVIVIVFRGTDDLIDWLYNLDFVEAASRPPKIHRGFSNAYRSLKEGLFAAIERQHQSRQKIWVTGHSLGGALATAFLSDVRDNETLKTSEGITFGQPMVIARALAKEFRAKYDGKYVRFVNQSDLVTRVPPGFEHIGELVWFVNDKTAKLPMMPSAEAAGRNRASEVQTLPDALTPMSEEEFEKLKAQLEPILRLRDKNMVRPEGAFGGVLQPLLQAHAMDNYVERIENELMQRSQ